jgi:hypothetical protein
MKRSISWAAGFVILSFSLACSPITLPFLSSSDTPEPTIGPTATPQTAETPTSAFDSWPTYTNEPYGFQLKYPPAGKIQDPSDVYARIELPFAEGTTLANKFLEANVYVAAEKCASQAYGADPSKTEKLQIHGTDWLKEEGESGGAGTAQGWVSYSTVSSQICINLNFTIVATNPDMYDPTPPPYNRDAETAIFADIVSTFQWLNLHASRF